METSVRLRFLRIAPRKVRLVARSVRNSKVEEAKAQLSFIRNAASEPLLKLLKSAEASAKEKYKNITSFSDWKISELKVDQGPMLKRQIPLSRGRSALIRKRMSHITLKISLPQKEKSRGTKS